mgnify:CR=1 FL=1
MNIYKIKVVAQVFYITEIHAESKEEAKKSAADELDDLVGDSVESVYINWTEILWEEKERE